MNATRWRRWTITHELTLLVLATLLPFAILGVYWAIQDYRAEQAQIQERALSQARDVSAEVDQFVADTAALAEALAQVPTLKRTDSPEAGQFLASLANRYPFYESLFVAAPDGTVLAAGGADVPLPGNRMAYIRRSLETASTVVTDPIMPRGSGRHVFVVATPIWGESGAPIGVVGVSVNLLRLQEGMRRADLPENSSMLVVDTNGLIVARRTAPELWVGRSAMDSSAVRDALRLREGVAEGDFVDGVRRLSGFAPARRVPWEVIVGIPTNEAYGALWRELWRAVARLAAVGLIAGLLAGLMSRRLRRPIRRLAEATREYAAGNLAYRTKTAGEPEEIATLAVTLNRMAAALQAQMAELQQAQQREREAGERALAELRRLHSEFVAVAAHELRTPVAAAKSYAELLLRDDVEFDPSMRRQALERLDSVCDRLARLVRSLLSASRIQAGNLDLQRTPVEVLAIVRHVQENVPAVTAEHALHVEPPARGEALALADAERVEDVLVNLLTNAAKYSPPGTPISVRVLQREHAIEVQIVDEGPGIPEDEQAAVFERFRRGRTTVGAGGVGLGLYIARAYVEAMGGQIGVRSAQGQGATFWFRLPLAPLASRTRGAAPKQQDGRLASAPPDETAAETAEATAASNVAGE